jgi:hypothetical protein
LFFDCVCVVVNHKYSMVDKIKDVVEIIQNIEHIYGSNSSLKLLKDFERVLDELDVYVYDNWLDGELVSGPTEKRYFVECVFMWPKDQMPEPKGGLRLIDYGCQVQIAESQLAYVRKIKKPDDIRPGTRKGKIDMQDIWMVRILMPKKLMHDINRGYTELDRNKVEDLVTQFGGVNAQVEAVDEEPMPDDMSADSEMEQPQ